jgi:hypothetical protein
MQDVNLKKNIDFSILLLVISLFIIAISSNYYYFIYTKNYDYLVRVDCNPSDTECTSNSCEDGSGVCGDDVTYYNSYYINANNFHMCNNSSCDNVCNNSSGNICRIDKNK